MKKFKQLVSMCKSSVSISVNDHKDCYETVSQYISDNDKDDIPKDILNKMVDLDVMVCLIAYPNTPVSFLIIYHYDIDKAITTMIEFINNLHVPNE